MALPCQRPAVRPRATIAESVARRLDFTKATPVCVSLSTPHTGLTSDSGPRCAFDPIDSGCCKLMNRCAPQLLNKRRWDRAGSTPELVSRSRPAGLAGSALASQVRPMLPWAGIDTRSASCMPLSRAANSHALSCVLHRDCAMSPKPADCFLERTHLWLAQGHPDSGMSPAVGS